MGEDPEKGLGGDMGSLSRGKAAEHKIEAQKSKNFRLARPLQ